MSDIKLTVLITEELRRQAKAAAALRGETLSDVVRSALTKYVVDTTQRTLDPKEALQHDPLLSMRFTGGPGDAAERVEEILMEAADPITGLRLDDDGAR